MENFKTVFSFVGIRDELEGNPRELSRTIRIGEPDGQIIHYGFQYK